MKNNIIEKLYKKDKKLAIQVAKVLRGKIRAKSKKTVDEIADDIIAYLSRNTFNYINKIANNEGYIFKLSVRDFEKYLKSMLVSKLK